MHRNQENFFSPPLYWGHISFVTVSTVPEIKRKLNGSVGQMTQYGSFQKRMAMFPYSHIMGTREGRWKREESNQNWTKHIRPICKPPVLMTFKKLQYLQTLLNALSLYCHFNQGVAIKKFHFYSFFQQMFGQCQACQALGQWPVLQRWTRQSPSCPLAHDQANTDSNVHMAWSVLGQWSAQDDREDLEGSQKWSQDQVTLDLCPERGVEFRHRWGNKGSEWLAQE